MDGQVTCTEVPELASTQEEADTKMMLHAKHASEQGYQNIIIKSSDTDVEVLSCFFQSQIKAQCSSVLVQGNGFDLSVFLP